MVTYKLLVAFFLLFAVDQCLPWPVQFNNDAKIQHFDINDIDNAIEVKEKLNRYQQNVKTFENTERNGLEEMHESEMEDLKKHWLSLLGIRQEPETRNSRVRVPLFMKAVYSVYDAESNTVQFTQPPGGMPEDEDRTIRALLPQKGMYRY